MNSKQALKMLFQGKKIRNKDWVPEKYIYLDDNDNLIDSKDPGFFKYLSLYFDVDYYNDEKDIYEEYVENRSDYFKMNIEQKIKNLISKKTEIKNAEEITKKYFKKINKLNKITHNLLRILFILNDNKFELIFDNVKYEINIYYDYNIISYHIYFIKINGEKYNTQRILQEKGIDFFIKLKEMLEKRVIERTQEIDKINRRIN